MLLVVILLFTVVIGRLTQLQVLSQKSLADYGESQRIRSVNLSADRGSIFDRNGNDLAQSVPQQTISADPSEVTDPFKAAALLAPVLGQDIADLQTKLTKTGSFVYLARKVNDDTAAKVKALEIVGVHMYSEPKRFLPGDDLMSSVIGTVGIDNEGLSGLELEYEKQLKGTPGKMRVEQDLGGRDIPGGIRQEEAARRGDDLLLTIDRDLQFKVEEALTQEIIRANAKGGMAAVMDTKSGEILAMASLQKATSKSAASSTTSAPASDSETTAVEAAPNNATLTNVYEPGSVSKLITMSAALESKIVSPTSSFAISDQIKVADATFHDAEAHPVNQWTTTDILAASSNVGTITIAQQLGKDRLDQFQRAFGYGSKTGLNFPGESKGLVLDPKKYSGTSLATTAIGQGVSVTAMQMLGAFNTIANNGQYIAPKLVKATVDDKGKVHETPASPTHRVVSELTATQMNLMLREVVRVGTATAAQIDGYDVAGKTGTARKPRTDGPGYEPGAYISSFAGFVPASDPRLTGIVILDEPTPIFGGIVAAPVFQDITRYALQEYGIRPATPSADRHGVPLSSPTVSAAASESDAKPGTTAEEANQVTEQLNKSTATENTAPTTTVVTQ